MSQRGVLCYLAEPHVHESVPGLADLSHVQLSCPGGHQAWCHASWEGRVETPWEVQLRMEHTNTSGWDEIRSQSYGEVLTK